MKLREVAAFVVVNNQSACSDINLTSDAGDSSLSSYPGIPTLNRWGLLIMLLSVLLIGIKLR
jgi:hypothetical protein